jgi:hypothetical protein
MPDEAQPYLRLGSDRFCPECGQSLQLSARGDERGSSGHAWLSWFLVAVAAYILVSSGLSAWNAYRLVGEQEALLQRVFGPSAEAGDAGASAILLRSQGFPSAEDVLAYGRSQLEHDVSRLILGGTPGLLGLVAIAGRRLRAIRALVESAIAAFLALSLALLGYFLVAQLRDPAHDRARAPRGQLDRRHLVRRRRTRGESLVGAGRVGTYLRQLAAPAWPLSLMRMLLASKLVSIIAKAP